MASSGTSLEEIAVEWLLDLGRQVQATIIRERHVETDSVALHHVAGDMIFGLDQRVEATLLEAMERAPTALLPAVLTCEGLPPDGRRRFGPAAGAPRVHILVDPIDGTRNLMVDKRSGWFEAAIVPGSALPDLANVTAAVAVELPPSKQTIADEFWAIAGRLAQGTRRNPVTGEATALATRASAEPSLLHGFGQVTGFIPGVKRLAADLMETIAQAVLGDRAIAEAAIFEDQYMSTCGQLIELAVGRDRFCCDLRPLLFDAEQRRGQATRGPCCHPYDLAAALVAQQAGVIVTDAFGGPLAAPFAVDGEVAWCGYANENIRAAIEPVIQAWLRERL